MGLELTARGVQCVLSAIHNKSISKAAKEVFVTQQTLSKIIARLEADLSVELFNRTSYGVEPTEIALALAPVFQSFFDTHNEHINIIHAIINKRKSDKKQITISSSLLFLQTLLPSEIFALFPEFEVKTKVVKNRAECICDVISGGVGFCLKKTDSVELRYIPIIDEPLYVLMNKDHPLTAKKEIVLSDLKSVPQIETVSLGMAPEMYINACIKEGFYPNYIDGIENNINKIKGDVVALASPRFIHINNDTVFIPFASDTIRLNVGFVVQPTVEKALLSLLNTVKNYYMPPPVVETQWRTRKRAVFKSLGAPQPQAVAT